MKASRLPAGWDKARVQRVLKYYETQDEDEAVTEDEAAYRDRTESLVGVPIELLPAVRRLIARQVDRPAVRSSRVTKSRPRNKRKPSAAASKRARH